MINTVKGVALAYSGNLDTSIIIPWLKENYSCEVVFGCDHGAHTTTIHECPL
jgi:argininosuccinate synthase